MKNMMLRMIAAGIVLLCAAVLLVTAQTTGGFPDLDKNGKPLIPRPSPFLWYSPTDPATTQSRCPRPAQLRIQISSAPAASPPSLIT